MAEKQVSVRIKAEGASQLKAEFQSIGAEAQKSFGAIDRGARGGGQALQNVGFQVQDFAVQVAAGTDVSRALAQQLPQLLSGLGLVGVLFGTVTAVAIPLFAAFGMGTDKAKELEASVNDLNSAMSALRSATNAAKVDPEKLFGDFGAGAAQAREVLEIQRQIAAARTQNALVKTSGAIAEMFGRPEDVDALRAKIAALRAEIAQAEANPNGAFEFNFASARVQLEYLEEDYRTTLANIADSFGLAFDGNEAKVLALVDALQALSTAEGPRAQADAMAGVRAAIIDAAAAGGVLSEEAIVLLQNLTDAELAALGLAAVDIASPISAAAAEAGGLASNLWDAAAAQNAFNRAHMTYGKVGARGDPRQFMGGGATPFVPSPEVVAEADAMLNPRPARRGGGGGRRGGGGGGGGVSQAEREAARIYDQTRTAAEKYAIELEKLNDLHKSGHLDTETYNRAVEKLGKDLSKTGDLGKKAGSTIRSAFDNVFDDPAAALKDLAKQLLQMALYAELAKSFPRVFGSSGFIPLMNANGNVFEGGMVQAFAAGGIVSSATMFPMKNGMGVMGEAGPEAIMPLTRIGGKLGVMAQGGGGGSNVQVNVINQTTGVVQSSERRGPRGERQVDVLISESFASGRQDSALRSRFGSKPMPVKR
jgi:hypothetical protein